MGHEMSHLILRHGTHEATKANMVQLPAMLAGSLIGQESTMGKLALMGLGLGANSVDECCTCPIQVDEASCLRYQYKGGAD